MIRGCVEIDGDVVASLREAVIEPSGRTILCKNIMRVADNLNLLCSKGSGEGVGADGTCVVGSIEVPRIEFGGRTIGRECGAAHGMVGARDAHVVGAGAWEESGTNGIADVVKIVFVRVPLGFGRLCNALAVRIKDFDLCIKGGTLCEA